LGGIDSIHTCTPPQEKNTWTQHSITKVNPLSGCVINSLNATYRVMILPRNDRKRVTSTTRIKCWFTQGNCQTRNDCQAIPILKGIKFTYILLLMSCLQVSHSSLKVCLRDVPQSIKRVNHV
jgi:hypothetical protein